jgi:MFS family permease
MSAQPSPEDRLSYRGWRTTAGGALGVFLASLVVVSMPVLLKPLTAELGRSREAVAVAFAVAAGVGALCAVPYGMLLDRTEPRRVVVSSLVVFGLAFAALSQLGGDIVPLYLGFAVLGAAGMGSSPVAYGRAVASWFERRRGLALSLVVAGGALGGVVHPPLLQWAIHTCGWRTAVALYGGAVVCLGAPAVRWLVADRRPCV